MRDHEGSDAAQIFRRTVTVVRPPASDSIRVVPRVVGEVQQQLAETVPVPPGPLRILEHAVQSYALDRRRDTGGGADTKGV